VVHANQSFGGILGLPLAPARGASLRDAVRLPDLDALLEAAERSGTTEERELRFWAPGERVVRATATPLEAGDEHVLVLVLHDLSEAELVDRVRRDFVANVSHELKTPLTSLRGYAETLLDGGLDDVEHREGFVRVIRDQAERLQALVEDLLSLAELERPDARLRLEHFDLRGVVERQMALLRGRAEHAGLAFTLVPGGPVPVSADRARIEQVAANLLDNAVKYTERGGVTVTLGADAAHGWCEVADTGAGIPSDDLARVFERFYRVDKARAREKGGTGLGLSIVKHILALHDGNVSVQSAVGSGSKFRFELPAGGPLPGA
jgi:two-component system phosphate regulon sensor histidine kinase PhoR